jgi:hypothetical protein
MMLQVMYLNIRALLWHLVTLEDFKQVRITLTGVGLIMVAVLQFGIIQWIVQL